MNYGTSLVGIVALAICIIPILLLNLKSRKKEQKLRNTLLDEAKKQSCKISHFETWADSMIAIDEHKQKLFFLRKGSLQSIALSTIEGCRLVNNNRTESNKNGNYVIVDSLELVLTSKEDKKTESRLEFYNANTDSLLLSGELQIMEKWHKTINDALKSSRPTKK